MGGQGRRACEELLSNLTLFGRVYTRATIWTRSEAHYSQVGLTTVHCGTRMSHTTGFGMSSPGCATVLTQSTDTSKAAPSSPTGQGDTLTIIQDDQQWGQKVTHALDVANLNVLPDVAAEKQGTMRVPTLHMACTLPACSFRTLLAPFSCLVLHPSV